MNYWLHPEALQDLREAAEFYRETAGVPLAQAMLAEFELSVSRLTQHPGMGHIWRNGRRRFVMKRFPYGVIYSIHGDQLRILAVAHHSRRPGYWRGRK